MSPRPRSLARTLAFSVLATVLGLALLEGGARLVEAAGPGRVDTRSNLAFQQLPTEPLTARQRGEDGVDRLVFDGDWLDWTGMGVPTPKPADELRIVLVGGSATAGWNSPRTATAAAILERILQRATPDKRVRVVNLARTGFSSAQIGWVLEQLLADLEPDLLLTLMGNNEKHDFVVAAHLANQDLQGIKLMQTLRARSALVRLIARARPMDPGEVPEFFDGYALENQEEITALATARIDRQLRRFHALATDAGARMLIATVPINERLHGAWGEWAWMGEVADTDAVRTAHWAWYYDGDERALTGLQELLADDPKQEAALLLSGSFLRRLGREEEAQAAFDEAAALLESGEREMDEQARWRMQAWAWGAQLGAEETRRRIGDWVAQARASGDVGANGCLAAELLYWGGLRDEATEEYLRCHVFTHYLRGGPRINGQIRETAAAIDAPLVDLAEDLRAHSPDRLTGYRYFLDYCHYNPRGNWTVAHLLAPAAARALDLDLDLPGVRDAEASWARDRAGRFSDLADVHRWAGAAPIHLLTAEFDPGDPREVAQPLDDVALDALHSGHSELGRVRAADLAPAWGARDRYEEVLKGPRVDLHPAAREGLEQLEAIASDQGLPWPPEGDPPPR